MSTERTAALTNSAVDIPTKPRTVVVLHEHGARHAAASRWAHALAHGLDAQVVVVQLIAEKAWGAHMLFPHLSTLDSFVQLAASQRSSAATLRWQRWRRGRGAPARVRYVRRLVELAAVCDEEHTALLVVAGSWSGVAAARLTRSARAPVLVARAYERAGRVVVASNLEDRRYPVVGRALPIVRALGAQMTLTHNVPQHVTSSGEFFVTDDSAIYEARRRQLEAASAHHSAHATVALTDRADPAAGICQAAWCHSAGLIVVGVRGAWRLANRCTSSHVVDRSDRSVLMLPT